MDWLKEFCSSMLFTSFSFFFPLNFSSGDLNTFPCNVSTLDPAFTSCVKVNEVAQKVLMLSANHGCSMNSSTNSFSVIGGVICAAKFLHL